MNERKLPNWFYLFGFLLLLALYILSSIESAGAQQPNPMACDMFAADLLPVIADKQEAHFIFHGSLFQGLPTHQEPPVSDSFPNNAYAHPTDQPITWYEFLGEDMPDTMPCSFRIDVYDGENGRGYDVTIEYSDSIAQRTQRESVVCSRIEAIGAQSRGRGKAWSCGER